MNTLFRLPYRKRSSAGNMGFSPEEHPEGDPVVLTLDAFETVRPLDREKMTQEECASRMGAAPSRLMEGTLYRKFITR